MDGKPKMMFDGYLGSAADIVAAMGAVEAALLSQGILHLKFGDPAAWSMLTHLDVSWG